MPERSHIEDALDAALAGTFPASDPVSSLVCEESAARSTAGAGKPAGKEGEEKPD
jgi:hypothetical protein